LLWLLALTPLIVIPAAVAIWRGQHKAAAASALALRLAAFAALVMLAAGLQVAIRTAAHGVAVVAVVDQSTSIAADQAEWIRQQVRQLGAAMDARDRLAVIGFGRDVRMLADLSDPRVSSTFTENAERGATDLAGALVAAAGIFPHDAEKKLVLL